MPCRQGCFVRNYDLEFLKRFSMVLVFLAVVTLGLIIGAWFLHNSLPAETPPAPVAKPRGASDAEPAPERLAPQPEAAPEPSRNRSSNSRSDLVAPVRDVTRLTSPARFG